MGRDHLQARVLHLLGLLCLCHGHVSIPVLQSGRGQDGFFLRHNQSHLQYETHLWRPDFRALGPDVSPELFLSTCGMPGRVIICFVFLRLRIYTSLLLSTLGSLRTLSCCNPPGTPGSAFPVHFYHRDVRSSLCSALSPGSGVLLLWYLGELLVG